MMCRIGGRGKYRGDGGMERGPVKNGEAREEKERWNNALSEG